MKTPILLHIPEPCHENWDAMTPQDKGRHCQSCNKVVVDFSVMTDRQVLDYFKNAHGNTCGRFHNDQLQRPLIEPQKQPSKWNYFLASVASFFVGLKLIAQPKVLLGKVANPKQEIVNKTTQNNAIKGEVAAPKLITVTGKVTDEKGASLAGVSVTIGKTNKGVTSNSDGSFTIKCAKDAELIFRVVGFETKQVKANQISLPNSIVKLYASNYEIMGDISVTTYEKSATPVYDVKGFVFDENFKAIKDAVITVVEMNKKTTSNYLGAFEIENIKKPILKTLQIKADEYETEVINITDELLDNIDDLQIILKKKNNDALNADIKVAGKVIDEKGVAIAGASITIDKTNKGLVSDKDGNFSCKAKSMKSITVRAANYETKRIEVKNNEDIIIKLSYTGDSTEKLVFQVPYCMVKQTHFTGSAQTIPAKQIEAQQPVTFTKSLEGIVGEVSIVNNKFGGKVIDEKGAAITDASIQIKGTKLGTTSKADGSFELNKLGSNAKLTIVVSSLGYETKIIEVESKDLNSNLNIVLKTQSQNLEELIINVDYGNHIKGKYSLGNSIAIYSTYKVDSIKIKDSIIKPIQKLLDIEPVKIYPNPAAKNANVHIAIKQTGTWELQLFTVQSNLLSVKEVMINTQNQIIDYTLPNNIVSGNYFLRLVNKETKKIITEKIIVL